MCIGYVHLHLYTKQWIYFLEIFVIFKHKYIDNNLRVMRNYRLSVPCGGSGFPLSLSEWSFYDMSDAI